jgi:hypothetical protein
MGDLSRWDKWPILREFDVSKKGRMGKFFAHADINIFLLAMI